MKIKRIRDSLILGYELLRIRNCFLVFFGVLVAASMVYLREGFLMPPVSVTIAAISASLITAAGNVLNDYFDFHVDKVNKPHRPIPSGRISRSDAMMLSLAMFLIGLAMAKFINTYCLILAGINTAILIVYARYSKKLLLVSNISVSYLVASIFLFGVLAVSNGTPPLELSGIKLMLILASCAFFMTFSREIIKDIEDIEGDKKEYSVTLPIKIGVENARNISRAFALTAILLSLIPFYTQPWYLDLSMYAVPVIIADLLFLVSLTMDPSLAQRLMVGGMSLALVGFWLGSIMPYL